jgi:glycosyltransferase involved in cell wall biosynthesis
MNALGRALALADLLGQTVERAVVFTPDSGSVWGPAKRWQVEHRRGGEPEITFSDMNSSDVRWIWLVKPLRNGYSAAKRIRELFPDASFILDVDDDDEALSREFLAASRLNFIRLSASHERRQLLPRSIAKVRERVKAEADGFTAGTYTVARCCEIPQKQVLRIVHPRNVVPEARSRSRDPAGLIHVGFYGTVRPHKGIRSIVQLLRAHRNLRLHLFVGYDATGLEEVQKQILEHPIDEPWSKQFESVDAILLPQGSTPAADAQLPAKLVDAMRFGVPILASRTEAIFEIAGESLSYIHDWRDTNSILSQLTDALEGRGADGSEARRIFEAKYSAEAMLPELRIWLERIAD